MGGKPAPDYANIFMANIDQKIMNVTNRLFQDENKIKFFKHFLDDIFSFSEEIIQNYIFGLMLFDPRIKFTMNHISKTRCYICNQDKIEKIPIDNQVEIKDNKLITNQQTGICISFQVLVM